jgi:hypothetical protein
VIGANGRQVLLIAESRGSSSWSVWPQPVCIDTAVGLRVLVSKIHFIDAWVRMGHNRKGAKVPGSKFGIQEIRGQVFSGDSDMVANFVEGLLGDGCRAAGRPNISVLAEATVGVCKAFVVVLAEFVDRSSVGRSGERWFRGWPVQSVHGGRVVSVCQVEGSVTVGCVNGCIIGMDTSLDGGVLIGDAGRVGAICLQFGDELFVEGFGLAIALGSVGGG